MSAAPFKIASDTGDNDTPDDAEDPECPIEPTSEQDEREEGEYSPGHTDNEDAEDSNYMPEPEEEVSLNDEDFIVPEEPLDQEHFKRQLIATAQSLKKKQQLKAEQDTLNERWTKSISSRSASQGTKKDRPGGEPVLVRPLGFVFPQSRAQAPPPKALHIRKTSFPLKETTNGRSSQ